MAASGPSKPCNPAVWVARQTVANPRGVELGRKPVRIDAGALGPNLPDAPLTVTADHALLFGDMLVNAGALAEDGTPIRFVPLAELPTRFVWWHVELENHEVVLANGGVPAESFIDYVSRSGFDNYDEYLEIAGADRLIKEMPFARISARHRTALARCYLNRRDRFSLAAAHHAEYVGGSVR